MLLAAGASIVAANHAATDAHAAGGGSKPQRSRHPRPVAALQHQVLLLQGQRHAPCAAARSNPLHLAAARGDAVCASLLLQRHMELTDGLSRCVMYGAWHSNVCQERRLRVSSTKLQYNAFTSCGKKARYAAFLLCCAIARAALERLPDPRTQLNKDGFQPYMLAGNAGHWHVAQVGGHDMSMWQSWAGVVPAHSRTPSPLVPRRGQMGTGIAINAVLGPTLPPLLCSRP